ncbi:MAG: tryptophan 7-halogenase [Psychrosphaera sp.]|nr:tryptophan 7-halogenase [Psychrosphaera sp.]
MKTLNKIGITETEFMQASDASFKQGSQFINWQGTKENDVYYHPFMEPEGYTHTNLHTAWRQQQSNSCSKSFADTVGVQSRICDAGLAPKQFNTPEYAAVTNYGYHLDAAKFAELLQSHCTQKLGVKHRLDHVTGVKSAANGDIAAITCKDSGDISGDLFIDCTGLASKLLGEHYQIPFIEKKHILFNDSALAVQVPYEDDNSPIASATLSTAQSAGWIWDIGLPTRRGVGYTYSSKHIDDQSAEKALKDYLAQSIGEQAADALKPRKITFKPGHREKFWHKNCVAVGLSSGFLEPLEASALALVELSASMISEQLPTDRLHMDIIAERFNDRFSYHWGRVIDFLKLHYVLSHRKDSDYWRDNQLPESIEPRLQQLLTLWQYQPPSRYDFTLNEEVFPSSSYQYVLYGMGFETQLKASAKMLNESELTTRIFNDNQLKKEQFISGLPSNRERIAALTKSTF